jgi:hypothetical protein
LRCIVGNLATSKEYPNEIAFTYGFAKRTKRKEWNQYQQADDAGRNQLIERAVAVLPSRRRTPKMPLPCSACITMTGTASSPLLSDTWPHPVISPRDPAATFGWIIELNQIQNSRSQTRLGAN